MKLTKATLTLIALVWIIPLIAGAQSNVFYYLPMNTWDIGPRIGFTTSIINSTGDQSMKTGVKWGIVGGIFGRYQITNQWAIDVDLAYSIRGNKNEFANIESGYIDFSVTPLRNVKYRMFKQDMTFDFFLGPGVSILTASKDKLSSSPDITEGISNVEFNIVVGGGLPIGPVLLYATTRFGVTNLIANSTAGSKWHGITTEWTISYRLGKK